MGLAPDFKFTQQDLTELNADGNRDRGRNGEDETVLPEYGKLDTISAGLHERNLEEEKEVEPEPHPDNEDENPSW